MSEKNELQFLLESARGHGTAADRARWNDMVATDGELHALERLAHWLATGPTWDDDSDDEEHLDPMVIAHAAMGAERLFENPETLSHLGRCDDCLDQFDAALAERTFQDESQPSGVLRFGSWITAAASVLFLVSLLWLRGNGDESGWSTQALAQVEPLPVRTLRSAPDADAFDLAYASGLEHYSVGDFAAARPELERAVELGPDHLEARLYLGSALLLEGLAARASEVLLPAADPTAAAGIRDEALWLLAQAYLRLEEPASAIETLEARRPDADRHVQATLDQLKALRSNQASRR